MLHVLIVTPSPLSGMRQGFMCPRFAWNSLCLDDDSELLILLNAEITGGLDYWSGAEPRASLPRRQGFY